MLAEETGSIDDKRLRIIETQLDRLTQKVRNLLHSTRQPEPQLQPVMSIMFSNGDHPYPPGCRFGRSAGPSSGSGPARVSGDPGLLQQVFLNW